MSEFRHGYKSRNQRRRNEEMQYTIERLINHKVAEKFGDSAEPIPNDRILELEKKIERNKLDIEQHKEDTTPLRKLHKIIQKDWNEVLDEYIDEFLESTPGRHTPSNDIIEDLVVYAMHQGIYITSTCVKGLFINKGYEWVSSNSKWVCKDISYKNSSIDKSVG